MAGASAIAQFQAGALDFQGGSKLSKNQAREAAESFEAVFLSQVLNTMFSGIKAGGPFGGGAGSEIYRSMLNEEYAAAIARQGGIGIADRVYNEILKVQEIATQERE